MIRTSQLPDILASAYEARNEVVLCLIGKPGIGKTQFIYEFAQDKGAKVVEIIASQILPNEVSGITMPVDSTHSMEIYDHARLSSLEDGDILFFDELLQASPQTLSACLTLIQERRLMSGKKLPDIMIVAAANHLPSPTMIPMQIRQRFMFVDVDWDAAAWCKHVNSKFNLKVSTKQARDLVSFIDDNYNSLTPRTLDKLIAWRSSVKDDEDKERAWYDTTCNMFSDLVGERIRDLFVIKHDAKDQLKDRLKSIPLNNTADLVTLDHMLQQWDELSIKDIYAALQELDEWDKIQEVLSNTKIEEV